MSIGFKTWLIKQGIGWWMKNRPFSKEKREFRKLRRRVRKENRRRRKEGLELLEEPRMDTGLRTSTNTAIAGIVSYVATLVVGMVPALSFLADPQVQLGVVGLIGFVAARFSTTPKNPGAV